MGSNSYVSTSAAMARLSQLEMVANNLANADSAGYKADRAVFRSAFEAALALEDGQHTDGAPGGIYVELSETRTDHSAGPVQRTGGPLDVAIQGEGFFVLENGDSELYTRGGSFAVGPDRALVTTTGRTVLGEGGPIRVSGGAIKIRGSGEVVDSQGNPLGRLRVVRFEEPTRLTKLGDGSFAAPEDLTAEPAPDAQLLEGSLESSNVNTAAELARMMILQRAFDASMAALRSEDQATSQMIQEITR